MSLIRRIFGMSDNDIQQPAASAWTNPAWWGGAGGGSVAGPAVSQEVALNISTVYACVGLLSETIASLPLVIYRYLENEQGRERARNHPLYEMLHDQPNARQTAFEFRQMMMAHALLRGSGYARIVPGARGFVDALEPLHPDWVWKEKNSNGVIRYRVTDPDTGKQQLYLENEIFEVGGLSLDGWTTLSVVEYARDSMGLTLAAERYGGRFFRNDSRPGGVLSTDNKLSPEARKRLKAQWLQMHSGGNQWKVAVLEQGLQWQPIGISPDEAQFLQSREFQAEDVCRWFRVPPHMVGLTSKATSWGSGIEQQSIGFVTYTLRPWLVRWSQAIARDLILAPQRYFADFVVEQLLRGDIETRYNAYATARQWGWMSVNEIRQRENLNAVPGGDTYLQPMNMEPAGSETTDARSRANAGGHYRLLAEEAAGRLIRKEIAAIAGLGKKYEEQSEAWVEAAKEFYFDHVTLVAQTMRMSTIKASDYCQEQLAEVIKHGAAATVGWPAERVPALATMALSEAEND